jgi:hypothetical protein
MHVKLITRTHYLDELISVMHTPDIKVITGIRRSGKSKLLEALRDHVRAVEPEANIIHVNFNSEEFDHLREHRALHEWIQSQRKEGVRNYVLIDEVQMCEGFERAINSLHASERYELFITGSNAFLLSSDLATLFTGRTYEVEVFPFSFAEFCTYFEYALPGAPGYSENALDDAFDRYVQVGGMAGSYPYAQEEQRFKYLAGVFNTLIVRDIAQRYRIRNQEALLRIADYAIDNSSNVTSATSIARALDAAGAPIDQKTVRSYLGYLEDAYAFYSVRRYDVRGKKYLTQGEKFYLADYSFKYALLGTHHSDYGRAYENIVAIELLRRGYQLFTGALYNKEIDFVAIKRGKKLYIQVSDNIDDPATREREFRPLLAIKDAYPRLLIARTRHPESDEQGIRVVDIARWLVEER